MRDFGSGDVETIDILGLTKQDSGWPSVVWLTQDERENGNMPIELIPICLYEDEFYFCLDTSQYKGDECAVVAVAIGEADEERKNSYESFGAFFYDLVKTYSLDE